MPNHSVVATFRPSTNTLHIKQSETYQTKTIEELSVIAQIFLEKYPQGGIFKVIGEMGAGKTTFISRVCEQLGYSFSGSPTFSLVNEYHGKGKSSIFHFDLYRLRNMEEILDIGFDEYLDRSGYIFIEWPEMVASILPDETITMNIEDHDGIRQIRF